MRTIVRRFLNTDGTAAVEFALIVIPFFALVFATIWMGLLLYSSSQLEQATEAAARCWSVNSVCANTNGDPNGSNAFTYASARYKGLGKPTFQLPTSFGNGCAHEITGTVTINVNVVVYSAPVTLNSSACFP